MNKSRLFAIIGLILVLLVAIATYFALSRMSGVPSAGTPAYEQTVRSFYRGLASLQVGLLDAARTDFQKATTTAPAEPAAWANLGLAQLRLGELDAAGPSLERAASLAPSSAEIAFMRGRYETARGNRDQAIAHFRRAVSLDARSLQARTALIQEVENAGGADADAEAQRLLDELLTFDGDNPAVLIERARIAAKRGDMTTLADSVRRLEPMSAAWPPEVVERYRALQLAVAASNASDAARGVAFLRNVLAVVPTFRESRQRVTPSTELIAEPFVSLVRMATPVAIPSAPDAGLAYALESLDSDINPIDALTTLSLDGDAAPVVFAARAGNIRKVGTAELIPLLGGIARTLLPLDWNHDFKMDLAVATDAGVRLVIQSESGAFVDATPESPGAVGRGATTLWPADIEMDGDLDLIVGSPDSSPSVLRNNGDGTWLLQQPFASVPSARGFAWGDIDADGDPDAAFVDAKGTLHVLANLQAGSFRAMSSPEGYVNIRALALGDVNADGALDLVTLDAAGAIRRASSSPLGWNIGSLTTWADAGGANAETRVFVADLDNNGALDLLASNDRASAFWLAGEDRVMRRQGEPLAASIRSIVDLTGDGQLDLVGVADNRPVRFAGRGTRGYHFQAVRPRAQRVAGDQRVNSFGIGGEVEVRAGLLVQKQVITSTTVHVGLGARATIDVTRIVWPNGVPQAEFDPAADQPIVAEQRLKGSCPWIFADNGSGLQFVTDFLWRSPLGLRINAIDTAGVTQTEDWVKIRGDQLAARNGAYDIRITAELWETHFVDHVSLLVVDHPKDVAVFVDERFAREAPSLAVRATTPPVAVAGAWDETGRDVTEFVRQQDGRTLSTFERGRYQGIAADHFVEVDLGAEIPAVGQTWLVAYGFIYPTDSSINVAIGQSGRLQPRGLSLEALDRSGRWVVVAPDLGFPAGKNKTVLIDLTAVARAGVNGARRVRLRTNLEIYWDWIAHATGVRDPGIETVRLDPARAELKYRGYSATNADRRDLPEVPVYDRIVNTAPRWRDLEGFYTRFGDVRELLARVEDRYVIMNAGDELRLSFTAPPLAADRARDFVLIGDGWVKDGDFNTSFSKTVQPLPAHGRPEYTASSPSPTLAGDPVYLRHREDWYTFHTRFVSPTTFLSGLALSDPKRPRANEP